MTSLVWNALDLVPVEDRVGTLERCTTYLPPSRGRMSVTLGIKLRLDAVTAMKSTLRFRLQMNHGRHFVPDSRNRKGHHKRLARKLIAGL